MIDLSIIRRKKTIDFQKAPVTAGAFLFASVFLFLLKKREICDIIKPLDAPHPLSTGTLAQLKVGFIDHNSFYFMSPLVPLGSRGDAIV